MEVKEILKKIRQQEQEKKEHFFALELDEDLGMKIWLKVPFGQ